jgi:Protein of unknown function (DUF2442)
VKRSSKIIKIKKAEYLGGCALKLWFTDGMTQSVDFEPFLRNSLHSDIQKYLDRKHFTKFSLKDGELMWGDFDLIFPIMDLYKNSIGSRAS